MPRRIDRHLLTREFLPAAGAVNDGIIVPSPGTRCGRLVFADRLGRRMAERRHIVPDVTVPVLGAGVSRITLLRTGGSRHFGLIVVCVILIAGDGETARCQDDEKTKKRTNLCTFHQFDPPMFYCSAFGRDRVKFYHKMNGLSRPIILENAQKKGARRRRKIFRPLRGRARARGAPPRAKHPHWNRNRGPAR